MTVSIEESQARRGTLRVYLGAAPGVGKTFAMLNEGARRRDRGTDVVVALIETHGRAHTQAEIGDLEVVPRMVVEHRGQVFTEMDLDAVLERAPEVALVDELAHTNVPGSVHARRWQDVEALLEAGIDVVSTVNIQHLESLNDVVEQITGVRQREVIPDHVVRAAEQIELVDMAPEALQRRMAHGNVYPADRIDAALANYFRIGNLGALRELALLWVADRVDEGLEEYRLRQGITAMWETKERVVVALTGAVGGDQLIRRAARMATRARAELIAVHVQLDDGLGRGPDDELGDHRRLLTDLGGSFHEVSGSDVASALVAFARSKRATQLVIGATRRSRLAELVRGSVVSSVVRDARDFDVHVVAPNEVSGLGWGISHTRSRVRLPPRRVLLGWVVAVVGLPLLTFGLTHVRGAVTLPGDLMIYLLLVVGAASLGGLGPALCSAVVGSLLVNWYFTPPHHTFTIAAASNVIALAVFVLVGALVAVLVTTGNRRRIEAWRARADAESLSWATAALVSEEEPVPALLDLVTSSLGVEGTSLFVPDAEGGGTLVLEASGGVSAPTSLEEASTSTELPDGSVLAVRGAALDNGGRRVLDAIAAQVASAKRRKVLEADAATAVAASETDALRTALLRAVSHDLRTPLASIKASVTSLLQDEVTWSDADIEAFLVTIDDESDRLDHLIGNLLDMSRLEAGAVATHFSAVGPEEIVARALRSLPHAAPDVTTRFAADIPPVTTDATLVERALANVIDNALRHSEAPETVGVDLGVAAGAVHFRVVDRGRGVARRDREELHVPFRRLDDGHRSGVGLGLAVARGFVDAVGGELTFDDTPGGGLTVDISLPGTPASTERLRTVSFP